MLFNSGKFVSLASRDLENRGAARGPTILQQRILLSSSIGFSACSMVLSALSIFYLVHMRKQFRHKYGNHEGTFMIDWLTATLD